LRKTSEMTGGWTTDGHIQRFLGDGKVLAALGEGLTGTDTISSGGTSVTCTHKLGVIPKVMVTPLQEMLTFQIYVTNKTTTTFDICIDTAAEADYSFDWLALP
jgi:hypothetical protein